MEIPLNYRYIFNDLHINIIVINVIMYLFLNYTIYNIAKV